MYIYSYITTAGLVRKVNQDALLIKTAAYKGREILYAAVSDGIGGYAGGETASSFVTEGVSRWFERDYPALLREEKGVLSVRQSLDDMLHALNDDLNDSCTGGSKMGTTHTSMLIDPGLDIMLTAHVGDTRLYKIYEDRAEIVTSDHSVVAEEVRRGIITEESAKHDKRQNQITNCIGAGEKNRIYDFIIEKPDTECVYLLCSDGFRKMPETSELIAALAPSANNDPDSMNRNLKQILDIDYKRKENDNITAVAIRYKREERAE